MTTLTPTPDAALPPGADPEHVDSWETDGGVTSRLVWSAPMPLPENLRSYDIRLVASQRPDGTIVSDDTAEGPFVYIGNDEYSPADTRLIAKALLDAANLADQWAGVER